MRVLIADQRSTVRSALRLLLEERLDLDVVGEAADNLELLAQLPGLRPDIILLDWELPGRSMVALLDVFRRVDHQPGVIVLGTQPEVGHAALAAGADAYVSKGDPPKRLLTEIRALSAEDQSE